MDDARLDTLEEKLPFAEFRRSWVVTVATVKELGLVPIRNPASCGAGEVLTPSNVAVRVAPDALTFEEETAVMFPSPEVPPPDPFQSAG